MKSSDEEKNAWHKVVVARLCLLLEWIQVCSKC